jgi:hypothetical protein
MDAMHGDNFPRKLILEHYIINEMHRDFPIDGHACVASVASTAIDWLAVPDGAVQQEGTYYMLYVQQSLWQSGFSVGVPEMHRVFNIEK